MNERTNQPTNVTGTTHTDAPELTAARASHDRGQYLYDSEKTDVWAVGFIYFQLRTGIHLREKDILKFDGRETRVRSLGWLLCCDVRLLLCGDMLCGVRWCAVVCGGVR